MPVDPNAIATWANAVTVGRVLVAPVLFAVIPEDKGGSWFAFVLWFVLCASDGIDGYLARRHGTTHSGAFLDPLADKVLVLGAMFTLVSRGVFGIVPVLIIAAREIAISVYRVFAGARGVSVPATRLAKLKTVCQQFAVAFALSAADRHRWPLAVVDPALDRRRAHRGHRYPVPLAGPVRRQESPVRCDVVAVGTELLLGQIVDTNSAWMGEQLASSGIDSLLQVKVGDNLGRITSAIRSVLADADARHRLRRARSDPR